MFEISLENFKYAIGKEFFFPIIIFCAKNFYLAFILFLFSCVKEVEVDIPNQESLPVINSLFELDSAIRFDIGKTQSIFEDSDTQITTAEIYLFENETLVDTLSFENENYESDIVAQPNTDYRIVVSIPDFATVSSSDKLYDKPDITFNSYRDSVYIGDEGDLFSQVEILIDDNPNEDNYYELRMKMMVIGVNNNLEDNLFPETGSDLFFDPLSNDIVLQDEGLLPYFPSKLIFSDNLFDGKKYRMTVNFRLFSSSFYGNNRNNNVGLVAELRKVSYNYYRYKKTLIQHFENQESDIWDGTGEPVQMFTNIENGYGIFAGYSQVTDTIFKN